MFWMKALIFMACFFFILDKTWDAAALCLPHVLGDDLST